MTHWEDGHRFEMSTKFMMQLSWKRRKVSAANNEDDYGDTVTHMSLEKSDKKVLTFLDYLALTSEEDMQVTAV